MLTKEEKEMANAPGPEKVKHMVDVLRKWQGLERKAMDDTAVIIEETKNPLVRMVMSIIRHDSLMHHRVQQFLIDSVTEADVPVSREDIAKIWEKVEEHDRVEKKTIELATELKEQAWSPVHKQLLGYLLEDEKKHDSLIGQLEEVKKGMSRASGG
jgi:ribonucleotide reductase beta subunit family protein with ferritin-like domain